MSALPDEHPHRQSDPNETTRRQLRDLVRQAAESGRLGAQRSLAGKADLQHWATFEAYVSALLAGREAMSSEQLASLNERIVGTTIGLLREGTRRAAYQEQMESLARHVEQLQPMFPADEAHLMAHRIVVWHSIWHLVADGVPLNQVRGVIAAQPDVMKRVAELSGGAADHLKHGAEQVAAGLKALPWTEIRRQAASGARRGAKITRRVARAAAAGARSYQAARDERRQKEVQRAGSLRERAAEAVRQREAERGTMSGLLDTYPQTGSLNIDGQRMRGSIVGTWLALVMFSWVSLVWGAMISAPFGVGLAIIVSWMAGIVLVPLWGTIWGFGGMSSAKASTLRQMQFKPVPMDSRLARRTQELAERLGLPAPELGTVPVMNAFAVGSHEKDAAVAIGEPILDNLTRDEVDAIIGHELGHIVSGDMRRMMLMRTFQNATVWFALLQGLKMMARAIICWAAEIYILSFSRKREYWADAVGAALTSKEAMIGALRALENAPSLTSGERAHIRFMFHSHAWGGIFSTHPSTEDRIRALERETYLRRLPVKGGR